MIDELMYLNCDVFLGPNGSSLMVHRCVTHLYGITLFNFF